MNLITKEYATKQGFKASEEKKGFILYVNDYTYVKLHFEALSIQVYKSDRTLFLYTKEFTEERLDSVLIAFGVKPTEDKKTTKKWGVSTLAPFIAGLVCGWESGKYKPVEVCTSCLNQVGTQDCCSDSSPMLLKDYLRECKKFSLKYSKLKRQYNALIKKLNS